MPSALATPGPAWPSPDCRVSVVTVHPRARASSANDSGREAGTRDLAHERAPGRRTLEQSLGDQRVDGLSHRHPGDSEVLHQTAFGGCRRALGQILDQVADVFAHLDVLQRRSERRGHLIHAESLGPPDARGRAKSVPEPPNRQRFRRFLGDRVVQICRRRGIPTRTSTRTVVRSRAILPCMDFQGTLFETPAPGCARRRAPSATADPWRLGRRVP